MANHANAKMEPGLKMSVTYFLIIATSTPVKFCKSDEDYRAAF